MRIFLLVFFGACLTLVTGLGFRGCKTENEPIEVFPDMDHQAKYKPQTSNDFWPDERDNRPFVPNTVRRGSALNREVVFARDFAYDVAERPEFYLGKDAEGNWVDGFPLPVTNELMELGREKYDIFCTVCHGAAGNGMGVTAAAAQNQEWMEGRGYFGVVASYHTDTYRAYPEGRLFDVIQNGYNTMYAYGDKLTAEEIWAVVAYIRALQLSQLATAK
ncbi:MAG: c-type cytochrome [Opitutales bacterium]